MTNKPLTDIQQLRFDIALAVIQSSPPGSYAKVITTKSEEIEKYILNGSTGSKDNG